MGNIALVKDRVQEWLAADFNSVTLTQQGGYTMQFGSSRVFVDIEDLRPEDPEGLVMVRVTAPCVFKLKESPELYKYVALHSDDYRFGHMYISAAADGTFTVGLTHQILANYLDQDELKYAVAFVGGAADEVDDVLQKEFGGERFHED